MILYRDPEKAKKLQEAIARGLISLTIESDGVPKYSLTPMGQIQWAIEKNVHFKMDINV